MPGVINVCNTTVEWTKEKFNRLFPYLKLEIYKAFTFGENNVGLLLVSENHVLLHTGDPEAFMIKPEMTVPELLQEFKIRYNLDAKVFRQCGNVWLETSITDKKSLGEQNRLGETITASLWPNKDAG